MTTVKSSNIAAAQFIDGAVRIQYLDGKIYEQQTDAGTFQRFMDSESKGRFARENFKSLVAVGGVVKNESVRLVGEDVFTYEPPKTVNDSLFNLMADDECCSKHFHDATVAGNVSGDTWECPECGCEWKAEQIAPNIRQWRANEVFTIIRVRS